MVWQYDLPRWVRAMGPLQIAVVLIGFLAPIIGAFLIIWMVAGKKSWRDVRGAAMFGAYGIAATAAFFAFAAWSKSTSAAAAVLLGLCVLSYVVAEAIDQL
jgi:hypothetical protein